MEYFGCSCFGTSQVIWKEFNIQKPLIMLLIAVESKIGTLAKTCTVNRDDTQSMLLISILSPL